ncbi:tetratricopeptide repeat protein [Kiloniella laminariae]|uniref:Tetratricopeptide repeat protein n=1 Tax=Kiloniella laminariae TaxID=454162 RepID=A0ABT4LLF6_9PROT|nr:tetratricopeptide repeat protein [Kiloniella laminariae]MCZ4281936.1 tetratricopeptide repeat protein [Kiloniella laminariae]
MDLCSFKRTIFLGSAMLALSGCSVMNDISLAFKEMTQKGASPEEGSTVTSHEDDVDPATAEVYNIAEETYKRGDIRTAIGLYQRAFELDPSNPRPMIRIGEILIRQGEHLAAGQAYRQALVVEPKNTEAKRGLGVSFLSRGQVDLAIEQFSEGLAIEKDSKLLNVMGVAYDKKEERQTAQKYYREGLEMDPDNLTLRSNLGLSLAHAGQHNEAITLLYAVSKEPRATIAHRQMLAMAYTLAGDLEAAEQTSRIDMDDADVAQRMRYFGSLNPSESTSKKHPTLAVTVEAIESEPLPN